jgi:hypothetical protein
MSIESIAPLALPTLAPIASPVSASALPAVAPLGGGFGSMVTHGWSRSIRRCCIASRRRRRWRWASPSTCTR